MPDPAGPGRAPERRLLRTVPPHGEVRAHLVLGHDRSAGGAAALPVAADLAGRLHAQLHVVHGVDLADYPFDPDGPEWQDYADRALADQRRQVADALRGVSDAGWSYHAAHGSPVDLLVTVADETDALMIIVGTRGEGVGAVFSRILDRSVSHGLLAHQDRPVLLVPARGR